MGPAYIAVSAVLAGVGLWIALVYNRLVRDRNNVAAGWSDIGVQLQRRHDLLPKLVDAVRAYADYEQATLTAVTELRVQSERETHPAQKARIEDQLHAGVERLLAVAEDYPDLKANRNFLDLQDQITDTENKLQYARRYYNGAVRLYNTRLQSFPDSMIARALHMLEAEYFEAEDDARVDPTLDFSK